VVVGCAAWCAGRAWPARVGREIVVGDLAMDEDAREVRRGGDLVELTATEFELLRYLMRNPRRVLSKAQILDASGTTTSAAGPTSSSSTSVYLRKKSRRTGADHPHGAGLRLRTQTGRLVKTGATTVGWARDNPCGSG